MSSVEDRLVELGLQLPAPRKASGHYVGFVRTGDLLFLSGQGSEGHSGRVGADLDVAAGGRAARASALNLLAQLKEAAGSLDAVERVVRVHGFVACTEDFRELPQVVNGASDLFLSVFGPDVGSHARSAIGASSLPLGFAVEVEMVVALRR